MEPRHDSSSRAAGAVALLGLVTHTGPRHSTSLLAATGTWQVSLSAHESPEGSSEPSEQQGRRGCCSGSKGSQRGGRSPAGALVAAVHGELQILTSPREF